MIGDEGPPQGVIWATRGRSWGFRFLLDGDLADPLPEYERLFAHLEDESAAFHRSADGVALRFPDPLGRSDAAGRVIPHEFVVFGELADQIQSVEDGLELLWPRLAEAYERVWDAAAPPSREDLRFTT